MQNITSATTTTLIEKEKGNGNVGSMRIVNNHSGDSQISVWITDDTTDFYLIKKRKLQLTAEALKHLSNNLVKIAIEFNEVFNKKIRSQETFSNKIDSKDD